MHQAGNYDYLASSVEKRPQDCHQRTNRIFRVRFLIWQKNLEHSIHQQALCRLAFPTPCTMFSCLRIFNYDRSLHPTCKSIALQCIRKKKSLNCNELHKKCSIFIIFSFLFNFFAIRKSYKYSSKIEKYLSYMSKNKSEVNHNRI